jgi:hypothetical protein
MCSSVEAALPNCVLILADMSDNHHPPNRTRPLYETVRFHWALTEQRADRMAVPSASTNRWMCSIISLLVLTGSRVPTADKAQRTYQM